MSKSAEDAGKQFYVAVTRAKDVLVLSYSVETLEGRERKPSVFIPDGLPAITPEIDPLPILHSETNAPELVRQLTREYLSGEGLSPSALADYLESPAMFFARRVLHLKEPEQSRMLIGTAVHAGIAVLMKEDGTQDGAHAALESTLNRSLMPRTSAFDQAGDDARMRLNAFSAERGRFGTATAIEKAYRATRVINGETVNVSGKVDAVIERDGRATIVDFKTSSSVKENDPKFALQLAFYDFLLRENGETPTGAAIVQVRPDGVDEVPILLTAEAHAEFEASLDAALSEMLTGAWRPAKEASVYDDLLQLFL